jgi:hypothetical protein
LKGIKFDRSFGQNIGIQKKLVAIINGMPCNRLSRTLKTTDQKADGTRGDH